MVYQKAVTDVQPVKIILHHPSGCGGQILHANHKEALHYAVLYQIALWQEQEKKETNQTRERFFQASLVQPRVEWDALKNNLPYPLEKPIIPQKIADPIAPDPDAEMYQVELSFWDKWIKSRKTAAYAAAAEKYQEDYRTFVTKKEQVAQINQQQQKEFAQKVSEWQKDQNVYEEDKRDHQQYSTEMQNKFGYGNWEAVRFFAEALLNQIQWPFAFMQEVQAEFNIADKRLIVDYAFPAFRELQLTEHSYEQLLYQMVLVLLNKLFRNLNDKVEKIVLNGKVFQEFSEPRERYFLSIPVSRNDFERLKLNSVDLNTFFFSFGGRMEEISAHSASIEPYAALPQKRKEAVELQWEDLDFPSCLKSLNQKSSKKLS